MICTKYRVAGVLLLSVLLLSGLAAADDRVRFTSLTMKDGLANSSISSIVQDGAGFLWIGSQSGLHRYDGSVFTVYQNEPFDPASLPHNLIQTMYMDTDGYTLWLGTYGGLARLDTRTNIFSSWVYNADDTGSLINDIVITIARDAQGRLWAGTMEGICRLDEVSGRITRYVSTREETKILSTGVIRSLFLDSRGDFWVGSSGGGLFRYDPARDDFEHIGASEDSTQGLPGNYVMSIDEDSSGRLWFGCWFYGLGSWDPRTGSWKNYPLADNRVYFVNTKDPDHVYAGIWGGGLYVLDQSDGHLTNFRRDSTAVSKISHDTLYSMFIDAQGTKWIGTNGGGLNRLWYLPEGLEVYEHDPDNEYSRSAGRTSAILLDGRGRLWVGTHNSGLNMLPAGSDRFIHYRYNAADPRGLPNDVITGVYEDSNGTIWILSNQGISRYLEDGSGFATIQHDPARSDSLPDNIV
ncbi:MAG: hypothetical protein KKC64_10930, partial [Spirochaetes bacterium]|nr:hypothetical protein [Spirochaetota bacterium]